MRAKFSRKRHVIYDLVNDTQKSYVNKEGVPSISRAKKESHKIQMQQDGAIGRGSLIVVK